MSDASSSGVQKLRVLSEVPRSEYAEISAPRTVPDAQERSLFFRLLRKSEPKSTGNTQSSMSLRKTIRFNAAAWISFRSQPQKSVSLWLNYKDEQGVKSVMVDEAHPLEAGSLMLSGTADVKVRGELLYIHACVGGLSDDDVFRVDELYVQRAEANAAGQRHSA